MAAQKTNSIVLSIVKLMFSRRYMLTTILIFIASAVCVRLGIWQVSRFNETRAFYDHMQSVQTMPPLNLPAQGDLTTMEYRPVTASGMYDFQDQIATRDQYNGVEPGYHLITPLRLSDGEAVLVDRGWIPSDGNSAPADWHKYDQPGQVAVSGIIRLGQTNPTPGSVADPTLTPDQTRLDFWVYLNLDRIKTQIPYPILPVYIELTPIPNRADLPLPILEPLDLSDGATNLNYVFQWNLFAVLFIAGYGYYLWRKELRKKL
jgi:surfeit locus 1 family protein